MKTNEKNLLVEHEVNKLYDLSRAMFNNSFPCNPLPFLIGLIEGVKNYGTDYLKTVEAQRILFVVIAQSYGQLFDIDSLTEFSRLK
jgi:hypothetical protein